MLESRFARNAVALAADEEYAIPALVTIYSLLHHAKRPESIQLYVLLSSDFPVERKEQIDQILMRVNAPKAIYFDMGAMYDEVSLNIAHTSSATFFRLKLPDLLPHEDRCLYLDTDLLVCDDLSELFRMDFEDCYFASVTAAFYCDPQRKLAHEKSIDVPDLINYPNAGVLVMNLGKMREDGLSAAFDLLVQKNYPMQDQDVLYKACYGKIKRLRPTFNALNGYGLNVEEYGWKDSFLPLAYTLEEWREACESPKVVHFARPEKPWFDYSLPFADIWWDTAFHAGIGEDCFFRYMRRNVEYRNLLLSWREKPWFDYSLPFADIWWDTAFHAGIGEDCFFRYMRRNVEYRNLLLSWREKEKWQLKDRMVHADEKIKQLGDQLSAKACQCRESMDAVSRLEREKEDLSCAVDHLRCELERAHKALDNLERSETFLVGK